MNVDDIERLRYLVRRLGLVRGRNADFSADNGDVQTNVEFPWLAALDRPAIHGVLVWRWFTDPDAGGPSDGRRAAVRR